uniref:Uncharacterized protein n=1 Tax=Arundo donax TaxID=35708 RepID=A0A0A9A6D9_ARUDO
MQQHYILQLTSAVE